MNRFNFPSLFASLLLCFVLNLLSSLPFKPSDLWSDQNVFHIHDEDFDKKIEQKVTTLRQRIKKLEDNQEVIFEEARGIKSKVK